jgi:hypothetical protein
MYIIIRGILVINIVDVECIIGLFSYIGDTSVELVNHYVTRPIITGVTAHDEPIFN